MQRRVIEEPRIDGDERTARPCTWCAARTAIASAARRTRPTCGRSGKGSKRRTARLGVALEPLASARDLDSAASQTSDRRLFAHAIAWDLGSFVSSFERSPADVVDRLWLRRFDEKYARDPSYFLKKRS